MTTFLIVLVFAGLPLAITAFIIFAAVIRAKRRKTLSEAARKYVTS